MNAVLYTMYVRQWHLNLRHTSTIIYLDTVKYVTGAYLDVTPAPSRLLSAMLQRSLDVQTPQQLSAHFDVGQGQT